MDFLEKQAAAFPEQKEKYTELIELYQKKLWHQIGQKLLACSKDDFFHQEGRFQSLFENFVSKCKIFLNPLLFSQFAIAASNQITGAETALKFLEAIEVKDDPQSDVIVKMAIARKHNEVKNAAATLALLEEARKIIDTFTGVMDPVIHSDFYLASLEYYQAQGPAAAYFKNSLLYLTYTPLGSIPKDKQVRLAADVTLAALVGHHIYNFGELLQHPIVNVLKGTEHEWLGEMLLAFNTGDIGKFKAIFGQKKGSQVVLSENESFLNQKIRIMALIEMIFQRNALSRLLAFSEVAATCELSVGQVELLLMKACSLGVVKGEIDQVEQNVRISYVQPRVLSTAQLTSIKERLIEWSSKVNNAARYLEENAPELLTGFAGQL